MKFPKLGSCQKGGTHCGRKGIPQDWVDEMYAAYQQLQSLEKVGDIYGRTRQAMWDIFKRRGLPLQAKHFQDKWLYGGRSYTPSKDGYLRNTVFRSGKAPFETQLHRKMWADHFGPIPRGFNVHFKDGNFRNFALGNLVCGPISQISAMTATGQNQYSNSANARLKLLMAGSSTTILKRRSA